MADQELRSSTVIASLNDLSALVSSLKSGTLSELIASLRPVGIADCSGHCVCVNSMCGCNNSVSAHESLDLDAATFLNLRAARMRELRAKLDALEIPERT